ncbi:chloride channel protein 2 isoform X1 [Patella vulgata]|uniref:chloride channel protein 2 isoform X1 n=2 Tax=Patella vulgata TaxID=6465 RepID=UPI0021800CB6|nr:chloride channel protein 2 isoform X1 [Patella vulgata]
MQEVTLPLTNQRDLPLGGEKSMAEKQKFGYEQTLLYGRYSRELGSFAKFQAKRLKKEAKQQIDNKPPTGIWKVLAGCVRARNFVFSKIGEDWLFLALLGILMALLSFSMDFIIEKCQEAKFWLYQELAFSVTLQYFAWMSYSVLFILFATGFTHLVSPQAIGSGIPEMKTILRGVILKEYLTFRTLIAKVVGLCASLGSTLPLGKEGPFVHIASIVATLLSKLLTSFRGIYENESRRSEMLAAACAVGVAGTFAAPIGGVLFSIEVTATYFAVRNYWRGFFSAVCGALVFRLLALWFKDEETITALFRTSLRTEFPFDPLELIAFAAIGVACGFGGALFIVTHRKVVLFTRKRKRLSTFLQKNRFIYPGFIALLISTLTFPPGFGQFFAGQLTGRQAVNELFSNITWTTGQADDLDDEAILSHWHHPLTNMYVTLVFFIIMTFINGVLANTLPIPAGIFVPVFTVGAAFGRLVGESMAAWFPAGIRSGDIVRKIVPGGYAVVGAASLSGSVTRTISTSVIVFELTGQISHVLPAVISVLIANAVANKLQPSFYDSIIQLKRLPYLPDIVSTGANTWKVFVEDFMVNEAKFISFDFTYGELHDLLMSTYFKAYPLVDSSDSMILLGSIQRYELERILWLHLSHDRKVMLSDSNDDHGPPSGRASPFDFGNPPSPITEESETTLSTVRPRFLVTKVDEENEEAPPSPVACNNNIQMNLLKVPSNDSLDGSESSADNYNTLQLPVRSILKKSNSNNDLMKRRASTGDLKAAMDLDKYYKKLSKTRKESIVEDRPYIIKKGSLASLCKKVRLPQEPIRVKHLTKEEQDRWEYSQLLVPIQWEGVQIDPAPFQLVERTSLHKVHSLFSLLGLNHAYVTNTGRLVGVVGVKELRAAVQGHLDKQGTDATEDSDVDDMIDPAQLEVESKGPPSDGFTLVDTTKNHDLDSAA